MRDPLRPPPGAANLGEAGLARTATPKGSAPLWEFGEVLAYNSATHTASVRTHSGRPLSDVPQMKPGPGHYDHFPTGTTVVISYALGIPVIMGCMDLVGPAQTAIPSPSITGVEGVGDTDPAQPTQGTNNYKPPGAPTDMQQGDWSQVGTLGNHVAVLEGGLTSFGSPTAGIQSLGVSGTLRVIAQRLQQFTDFGELTIENNQGRTSLTLRAGANQSTETGYDEQHWTIRLDLGATGDLLDFKITEPEGRLLFRLHAGSDGRVQIYGDGGVDLSSGKNGTGRMRHDVMGDHATTTTGDMSHEIQGDATTTVDGSASMSIARDAVHAVGGNHTEFTGNNHDVGVGGDASHVVTGKRTTHVGQDDETKVDGNSTVTAVRTATVEGQQVKLGAHAAQPTIRGRSFQSAVMARLAAAGTAASTAAQAANVAISPDVVTGTPTGATITAVTALITAIGQIGSLLTGAANAFNTTLSVKVKTE